MSHKVTFNVKDDKQNILGAEPVIAEFTNEDFEQGTLDGVEAEDNQLRLPLGNALEFNGSDSRATYGNDEISDTFSGSNPFAISLWYNHYNATGWQMLVNTFGVRSLQVQVGENQSNNVLHLRADRGGWKDLVVAPAHNENKWIHAIIQYDPSTGFEMYVDLNLVDSNSETGSIRSRSQTSQFGARGTGEWWNGALAEISFWSKTLNEAEREAVKNGDVDLEDSDLVRYWLCDEGEGEVIADHSANEDDANGINTDWTDGPLVLEEEGSCLFPPMSLSAYSTTEPDLRIKWKATVPENTTLTIETAVTDSDTENPGEGDWVEQNNGELITGLPADLTGKYLYTRVKMTSDGMATPGLDWLSIFEDDGSPYAFCYVEFDDRFKVVDSSGEAEFEGVEPGEDLPYKVYTYKLNSPYQYAFETEGTVTVVDQDVVENVEVGIARARLTNLALQSEILQPPEARLTNYGLQVDMLEPPFLARITNIGVQVDVEIAEPPPPEIGIYIRTTPLPSICRTIPRASRARTVPRVR